MTNPYGEHGRQPYQAPQPQPQQTPQYLAPTYRQTPQGAVASTYDRPQDTPRPPAATAAGLVTVVAGGLYVLGAIGLIVGGGYLASRITRAIRLETPNGDQAVSVLAHLGAGLLAALGVVVLLAAAFHVVLGVLVLRRKQWARVTLTVLLALGIAGGIDNVSQYHVDWLLWSGLAGLVLSALVLVLMWLPATNAWFRTRDVVAPPAYPTYPV